MTVHHLPKPIPDGDPNHQSKNFPVPGKSALPSHSFHHSALPLREETSRWLRHQPPRSAGPWLPLSARGIYRMNRCCGWGAPAQDASGRRATPGRVLTPASSLIPALITLLCTFVFFILHLPCLVLHFSPHILPAFIYHHPICNTISSSPLDPSCLGRQLGFSSKTSFDVYAPSSSLSSQHLSHNLYFSSFKANYIWSPSPLEDRVWGLHPAVQAPELRVVSPIAGNSGSAC